MALKRSAGTLLRNPTMWRLLTPLRRSPGIVLTYHRIVERPEDSRGVPVAIFQQQVDWLCQHCDIVRPSQALSDLLRRRRRPAVLVTFDDGYADFYDRAYPVLRRRGVEAVNFVATWFIDTGEPFWWYVLEAAVWASHKPFVKEPWSGVARRMDPEGRRFLIRRAKDELKKHARPHLTTLFQSLQEELAVQAAELNLERPTMSWEQIRSTLDVITVGGHAHTHAALNLLDVNDVRMEVSTCRDRARAETGTPPRLFAYPNGAFSPTAEAAVGEAGYDLAFSTRAAYVTEQFSRTAIPRVHAPASVAELAAILSGWTH